jgi:hypothetical protein
MNPHSLSCSALPLAFSELRRSGIGPGSGSAYDITLLLLGLPPAPFPALIFRFLLLLLVLVSQLFFLYSLIFGIFILLFLSFSLFRFPMWDLHYPVHGRLAPAGPLSGGSPLVTCIAHRLRLPTFYSISWRRSTRCNHSSMAFQLGSRLG